MRDRKKTFIVLAVILAALAVLAFKSDPSATDATQETQVAQTTDDAAQVPPDVQQQQEPGEIDAPDKSEPPAEDPPASSDAVLDEIVNAARSEAQEEGGATDEPEAPTSDEKPTATAEPPQEDVAESQTQPDDAPQPQEPQQDQQKQRARFVEVGAESCVPCKMMQPILDELRSEYKGELEVVMADVWKNPDLGKKYGVRSIPTQVIYDSSGEEVFRHMGYWPKEDIDAKLKELGIID